MTTVAVVQARTRSTRLPNKVLMPISGTPMIGLLLGRLARATLIDRIVVATTSESADDALAAFVESEGHEVYRGSEDDVLGRYFHAASLADADIVVRITADCPLIDPELVDDVVRTMRGGDVDFACNTEPPTYPDGLDVEAFRFSLLEKAFSEAGRPGDREHVTPFMQDLPDVRKVTVMHTEDLSGERWTVDEPEDMEVVRRVFEHFHPRSDFSWSEVLDLRSEHPEYFDGNRHFSRNEGAVLGTGQKLWKRARRVIPGGNMLLSKRPEMFLPEGWPAYFSRAKGCRVWDLDERSYIDMSIMGIGTNILGYGHPEVDAAVSSTIASGNMSTLNCPEEVYLAERLVELHPWADMVRLARTGGEAVAIAVRIARAASGRDKVAFCGYHGWHDWYLSANLGNVETLSPHLIPGLEPRGIPAGLEGTAIPFRYNRLDDLESALSEHGDDIGTIIMEVSRSEAPADGFLETVREMATARGIVLIFDESTSGFRQTFGGLHKLYGVEPDIAVFGKALGNGYAITAVIGRRNVMEATSATFVSSTFWSERIGPTAALATLDVMERTRSWDVVTATGREISRRWEELARGHGLSVRITGLPALLHFEWQMEARRSYDTLLTQQMLDRGFLAGDSVYVCLEHTPEIIDSYFEALDPVFGLIAECESGRDVNSLLTSTARHEGIKRLN